MNLRHFQRVRGILTAASFALVAGCYGFSGGGGFPSDIHTIYIQPFDNQTVQADLDQQLFRKLQERVPRALGGRPGDESNADAVIRGKILRYDDVAQNYTPGGTTTQTNNATGTVVSQQISITVSVELIDRKRNVILWDSQSVVGRGEYRIADENESNGRERALNQIIQQIIDGAQSQW